MEKKGGRKVGRGEGRERKGGKERWREREGDR